MSLLKAFGIWIGCLVILTISFIICDNFFKTQWLTVLVYLILGVFLNRKLLNNLVSWHPINGTVDNISSAKLGYIILWPLRYFVLLIRLSIIKFL